ncbi:MAG: hypothetical protein N2Z23_06630 [Pyrinomonadaceae bacterium]|nr:hypothetical protein [Pyrinomonadaceae bacterium]MCX7640098.1 hypothetical protein [Pyrinomonadaceae bacterium]MDW8304270.1 hypothetical protein [Acidobacteriota bacterium]
MKAFLMGVFSITFFLLNAVFAQTPSATPTLVIPKTNENLPVAVGNNLFCAGYIQESPFISDWEIVGSTDEREQNIYAENDFLYARRGLGNVQVGDEFLIVRPRGRVSSKYSKKGDLGIYIQELGTAEVVRVLPELIVVRVKMSCDNVLIGDLMIPKPNRLSPFYQTRPPLDLFAEPNGKITGRIVMTRDGREALSTEQIVYIDLGSEDNVKIGDYFTIFRPLGKGGVLNLYQRETMNASDEDFQSRAYKGSKFSIMAPRKSGERATGPIVTTKEAKSRRPAGLRLVVGELVVINVKEKTATALITRNTQEIHPGDIVELQ